ncbi:hypothetical protein CR205_00435 [Alteribacter lacisalsi]|uniref:Uncharacterized protein n=1 Tax=Alteribacter lacisalsi TaxID=2045244 RepID=A0A2W0HAP5_9BACI|nr:hypothetical protein [Alteribacter lacisalsi]PYZ97110.1 hypothetical protein CR205_00435 [Alteribacter lacisalsi]
MKKNNGFIFYGAVAIFSIVFLAAAISINRGAYAGTVNEPIVWTIGICIFGLAAFELYKRTFEKRHAVSSAVLCAVSVIFLFIIFPSYSYEDGAEAVLEYTGEDNSTLMSLDMQSFKANEQPSMFVTRYYIYGVETAEDEQFYLVNPADGETVLLETE